MCEKQFFYQIVTAFKKLIGELYLKCAASTMASDKKTPKADEGKNKPFRPYGRKPGEETKGGLPMLRFGKGNNFYKFKAQLSNVAIENTEIWASSWN
jgi:hypothetical protein